MFPEFKSCEICRHWFRTQLGPNFWTHDCRLGQTEFPDAESCNAYQPPPLPDQNGMGIGYVWNGELKNQRDYE